VDSITAAEFKRGLARVRIVGALRIELGVEFQLGVERVSNDEARQPATRSIVDKIIAEFEIHIDRTELWENSKGSRKELLCAVMPRRTESLGLFTNA